MMVRWNRTRRRNNGFNPAERLKAGGTIVGDAMENADMIMSNAGLWEIVRKLTPDNRHVLEVLFHDPYSSTRVVHVYEAPSVLHPIPDP